MPSRIILDDQPCPKCTSSDAYHVYSDGHGYCYSCNTTFKNNKDFSLESNFTYEYIAHRSLSLETLRFYDIKTKIDPEGKPVSVGFRYPNGSYKIRDFNKKDFYSQGEINKAGLFGHDKFATGSHKYVTITEGEYDAASLYQILHSPVVSVQSSSTAVRDCTVDRPWLNSFERVYLAFDDDEHGREATRNVAKLFDYNKVYHVKLGILKDANEFLQKGKEEDLRNIWWNARKYLPETVISSFEDFRKILTEPVRKGISYPFHTLTSMTYGIRTGESVLITAQEGVGKTELMHAIEHHLLKETDDAIGAIFLEEGKRRHLQAIAGVELEKPIHLPDCDVKTSEIISSLEKVVSKDDRLYIYSHFGSDDPEILLDTIRFLVSARSCRYILLDHISMVVSGLAGEDERRALDYISTRLEMMVKELDFALILVSHVNDEGLTRGSRYISKIADLRIDATRNLLADNEEEKNTVFLSISKNRFSGKTGFAGRLLFNPLTFTIKETSDGHLPGTIAHYDGGVKELENIPRF